MKKIAIIGGGAAGLMAAATLCERGLGKELLLLERNKILGQKVLISGGGRCNVTTGLEDLKELLKKYPRGANFLRTALYAFPPMAMREWVEAHGVPLKVEEDGRVFPKSDNGAHIVRIFERILQEAGVELGMGKAVEGVKKTRKGFEVRFCDGGAVEVERLILALGGQAYRQTGSQGDGYSFAETLGHHITALGPSLNALLLREAWPKNLMGISFEGVRLRFSGKEKFEFTGPILFTHKGLTGPAVFALSSLAAFETFDANKPARIALDFFPEENYEELTQRLESALGAAPKKSFHNVLSLFVPRSFAVALCESLGVDSEKQSEELSKKDLTRIVEALKNLSFTVVGRSAGEEFVTAGGVELSEVDSKSMESKLCPGLYFAGEILNLDGFTGGYNLQAAWATGRLAAQHVTL